jgi:hypothetical protein
MAKLIIFPWVLVQVEIFGEGGALDIKEESGENEQERCPPCELPTIIKEDTPW